MGKRVALGICMVAALASTAYGAHVWAAHSGTSFWMMWIVIACLFMVAGLAVWFGWWKALPKVVRRVCAVVLCTGLICFGAVEGWVISGMRAAGEPGLDYVIVLGAQVLVHDVAVRVGIAAGDERALGMILGARIGPRGSIVFRRIIMIFRN